MNDNSLIRTSETNTLPAIPLATVYGPEYSVQPSPRPQPQAGSVLDYWGLLWQSKKLFAACTGGGLAIALAVLLTQSPTYRARTTLEVQDLNHEFVDLKLAGPVADSSSTDALTDIQTQIKLLQSNTLIDCALQKAEINNKADLEPAQHHNFAGIFGSPNAGSADETLTEVAARNLKVNVAGQTRIIEVSFDAPRPELAAHFANALTLEFMEQNTRMRGQMNRQTSDWLAGQLADLRGKLETSENALEAYARKQSLIYTADKQTVSEEKLRQVQAELSRAQADRVEKQSRFEIARTATPDTLPEVLNDSSLRALDANLTELRRKEAEMEVTFTPDYSQAKKLRAEGASLEDAIVRKRAEIVTRIANELSEAEHREKLLAAAYADQTIRVTSDSQKSIQYDVLKREVDTNQQIYDAMLQRVKESAIASAIKASNVRVVDPAIPPRRPYKPNFPLGSAAGLLFGSTFGLVAIVLRSRTNVHLQEPGEAGSLLGIPELGVIPRAQGALRSPRVVTLVPQHDNSKPRLIGSCDSGDASSENALAVADSFRAVLASIILTEAKESQKVLVITSANSGEGKTTAAVNLAVTLAKMDRKVLLIDGDIRSPRMHQVFGLSNLTGLTRLLRKPAPDEKFVDPIIRAVSPNLYVLPAGPALESGADLLFSKSIPSLLSRYRERFDMILIDTPPMLAMPDARVLGRIADAVVLIARAGKTSRAAAQAAFRRLVDDQTRVLGVVLNDWNAGASPYKYYGSYHYAAVNESQPSVAPKES